MPFRLSVLEARFVFESFCKLIEYDRCDKGFSPLSSDFY